MNVEVRQLTSWEDVANDARLTFAKGALGREPSSAWRKRILVARHSPIQALMFEVTMRDIPYWVSVHLVRHSVGITHFVQSQRTDRTGVDRAEKPQNAPVTHRMVLNAQSIIAVSKKRLCAQASPETRAVWAAVRDAMREVCPELAEVMRPECDWCGGHCPELAPCGRCQPLEFD